MFFGQTGSERSSYFPMFRSCALILALVAKDTTSWAAAVHINDTCAAGGCEVRPMNKPSLLQTQSPRTETLQQATCEPAQLPEIDQGYVDKFRGWYDVQGCGKCLDYCRWVGGSGSGGDPSVQFIYKRSWWSCRLAGSTIPRSPANHFSSWRFTKCNSKGADAPSPAPHMPTPYVPGEPGATWTKEEVLIVRAKVRRLLNEGGALISEAGLATVGERWSSTPNAAKVLRLGFHDCLKYTDGSGGCDGCLEWNGVGERYPRDQLERGLFNKSGDGHNNGLGYTATLLDRIYTDRTFPERTPWLPSSLQQSGKSRADLFAFAVLESVLYSIQLNNRVCDNPEIMAPGSGYNQCHPRAGEPDCKVHLPRPFVFKTGRRDCISTGKPWSKSKSPSFMIAKEESHPDPGANGPMTLSFFKNDFDFNARETVAIMGAHTLGRVMVTHSLLRYTWKARSGMLFNNGYFRNLVGKEDWYYDSALFTQPCQRSAIGNSSGQRPLARWLTHVRGDRTDGGPSQWIQEKYVCPTCEGVQKEEPHYDCCTRGVPQGGHCRPGCEQWRFVVGMDETALNSDMGLYRSFQVDANGIPFGCPGLENFNMNKWGGWKENGVGLKHHWATWSRHGRAKGAPECPLNTYRDVGSEMPLHDIVQEYADNQGQWMADFVPALEKMLGNGYSDGELKAADSVKEVMIDFSCPFHKSGSFYICSK
eukprot:TRINITY_DN2391_c0_g1_i4.p1 TRINITY_DN2391_c0_g1~~TRINITY_DN2391_c0_g1_i4.p1  ORF type:complete len:703 (+),score=68.91 TRINITY_DN2391_c0_g1_i4:67-2175(+)